MEQSIHESINDDKEVIFDSEAVSEESEGNDDKLNETPYDYGCSDGMALVVESICRRLDQEIYFLTFHQSTHRSQMYADRFNPVGLPFIESCTCQGIYAGYNPKKTIGVLSEHLFDLEGIIFRNSSMVGYLPPHSRPNYSMRAEIICDGKEYNVYQPKIKGENSQSYMYDKFAKRIIEKVVHVAKKGFKTSIGISIKVQFNRKVEHFRYNIQKLMVETLYRYY